MWVEKLLDKVKGRAKWTRVREYKGYLVGSAIFEEEALPWVLGVVKEVLEKEGEIILSELGPGKIVDRGVESLKVRGGRFIEYYDYRSMRVVFIRLYVLEGEEGRWLALYIDENPETPWWAGEERST